MQKNECLQAADRDSKFRLDSKGTLEEILVIGPFRWHEGFDIDVSQRRRAPSVSLGSGFLVKPACTVIELRESAKREHKIDGTQETWIMLLCLTRIELRKSLVKFVA